MSSEEYVARCNRLFEGRKYEKENREIEPPDEDERQCVQDDYPPTVAALFDSYGQQSS